MSAEIEVTRDGCVERIIHGGVRGGEIDTATCTHPEHLRDYLRDQADLIARWLRDPEWPLADAEARRVVQATIARVGLALAQISAIVDDPPAAELVRAEIAADMRDPERVTRRLAAMRNEIEDLCRKNNVIPFPAAVAP